MKKNDELPPRGYSEVDEHGREVLDPRPMALPAGFKRPPTMVEMVRRLCSGELSRRAELDGLETEAEASDFDIPDDAPLPLTESEVRGMIPEEPPQRFDRNKEVKKDEIAREVDSVSKVPVDDPESVAKPPRKSGGAEIDA